MNKLTLLLLFTLVVSFKTQAKLISNNAVELRASANKKPSCIIVGNDFLDLELNYDNMVGNSGSITIDTNVGNVEVKLFADITSLIDGVINNDAVDWDVTTNGIKTEYNKIDSSDSITAITDTDTGRASFYFSPTVKDNISFKRAESYAVITLSCTFKDPR